MITDIYGESGSGKSQLCFTLCANCASEGCAAIFVDTAGTFRPERVVQISGSQSTLEKIVFVRALNTLDQANAVRKILDMGPRLVVFDTLTSLFSAEYSGRDRKSTRLNSSHGYISYAVFCLKKKK